MDISTLSLARAQFVASLSFLALFLAVSLALAWVLLFFKVRARWSGLPGWTAAYRFWVRIFALAFVLTLAASVPVLIQLGSLWAGLMDKVGNVAGPLLGYGILSVFILKSCFLGVMLFGQRRVSDGAHTLAVLMVAVGQLVAVFWVLALQSWMQTPDGALLVDGRYQVYDWVAVVLNPSVGWRMAVVAVGAALAASFLMMGVTALQALRRPLGDGERNAFKTALVVALVAAFLQIPVATGAGQLVAKLQPAKAAAAAGYWESGAEPELVLFGWPDARNHRNLADVTVRNAGGMWLHRNPDGTYQGLDKYSGMLPPVALTFLSLRVAAGLGLLMLAVACVTFLWTFRRGLDLSTLPRWWQRVVCGMMFSGGIAVVAGWWVSVIGLQPFVVNGTVTQSEVLGSVSSNTVLYGLIGYGVLYAVLLAAFAGMLFHAARYGVVPVRKLAGGAP
ncbi:transmembrane cytochrome oxidase [Achromobacter sp. HZ01]|jgi:cytochrome d ubiquinol oxidase subunit I|uniref:Cytochrome ubiquinol oxidase subunit I n=1 Tax=Achromobacter pulmonis TaxID=1389932 RepID=A0A2N8KBE7_9BURK|nr:MULTISPECIES: cytochrome ubiquinol oxidase subunit I [Achromobacter]PND30759.1 cytochrome ubiquinol oxidase subunit I [Achromobacter pulmonis]RAP61846.1 transmembrane cytochrome oxidase [Achromobacter sp. HZ01]